MGQGLARVALMLLVLPLPISAATAQTPADTARRPATPTAAGRVPGAQLPAADPSTLAAAPSGRVRTEIALNAPRAQGSPATAPAKIWIDYGQPHARGRAVMGTVVPFDTVWRTGANSSTTFSTDVDLTVGGTAVPKGSYSLYSIPSRTGWTLIVNRQTGQWGTQYDASRDLARIPMTARTLPEPAESFTIVLVPAADAPPAHGRLVMSWGTMEGSVNWTVGR
jgi:hypothetical protein